MRISSVQTSIITPKSTGYAATAALGATVLSGVSKNRTLQKAHKPLACVATVLVFLHIGIIEYYHLKYRSK